MGEAEPEMAGLPPLELSSNIGKVVQEMDVAGVDKSVIIPPHRTQYQKANKFIADLVNEYPDKLMGFGRVNPNCTECGFETAREAIEDLGLKGLYVSHFAWLWYDPAIAVPFLRRLFELNVPVMVDADVERGRSMLLYSLEQALKLSPRNVVIAVTDYRVTMPPEKDQFLEMAVANENLYIDTSRPWTCSLDIEVSKVGAERIIFGSDSPFNHPADQRAKIESMHVSDKEEELILGGNILRILRKNE